MDTITGIEAIRAMEDVSKVGGDFKISYFKYSRTRRTADTKLKSEVHCRVRKKIPREKMHIDPDNLFFFESNSVPRTCYRILIRYIGLSIDNYKIKKVKW